MTLRAVDPSPLRARYAGPSSDAGDRPELQWLKIARLRIDPRYQREIGRRGADNILLIAARFAWAKFGPVIVAPVDGGLFAIVDGQHRTTAAALRGFESVPCVIIAADAAAQADAFVAINANVTAMSPLQLHAARLAAGDGSASVIGEICAEAGVTICRYPVPHNKIKPGETMAVSMLSGAFKKYGREVLVSALSCITKTRRGNPGMIRAQIVAALCAVLEADPKTLGDREQLISKMQTFDFGAEFDSARKAAIESGKTITGLLIEAIGSHLDGFSKPAPVPKKVAVAKAPAAQAAAPIPSAAARSVKASVSHDGVTIELTPDQESVAFKGRRVSVSPRGARLVAALAKVRPNCIGDDFLIGKIWKTRPSNASAMLDIVIADLAALKTIGLEVRTQRGIGRQLVKSA